MVYVIKKHIFLEQRLNMKTNPFSKQPFLVTIFFQRHAFILALVIPILISCGGGGGGGSAPEPAPTPTFTVSATAGANGSISPATVTVTQGQIFALQARIGKFNFFLHGVSIVDMHSIKKLLHYFVALKISLPCE